MESKKKVLPRKLMAKIKKASASKIIKSKNYRQLTEEELKKMHQDQYSRELKYY